MIKLIADSGSTKTDWILCNDKNIIDRISTEGLNPFIITEEKIAEIIQNQLPGNFKQNISQLFFYGAGCAETERKNRMRVVLEENFTNTLIEIESDLLGAARACCGTRAGIVSIIGTGSSVCHYNGKSIEYIRPSLGYLIGDEGSGNYLGKKIIHDYFTGNMPSHLAELFRSKYDVSREAVLNGLYKSDFPNRYLASFALFVAEHIDTVYCKKIVKDSIMELFDHHILPLYEKSKLPVSFNGSIAYYFQEIVMEICRAKNIQVHNIIQSPGEDLVKYHLQN